MAAPDCSCERRSQVLRSRDGVTEGGEPAGRNPSLEVGEWRPCGQRGGGLRDGFVEGAAVGEHHCELGVRPGRGQPHFPAQDEGGAEGVLRVRKVAASA